MNMYLLISQNCEYL